MKQISFFCWILFSVSQTLAQNTNEGQIDTSRHLKAVQISATYGAEDKTPVSFQNLSPKDYSYKSVGQEPSFLLSETPSMTVYSDAGSYQGYSYFRLRGIDQTRINLSLNGVPLNEPEDQGVYFSNYPDFFQSISRVQIQRGVGTSKNGTASYAGSMNFSSPDLFDSARISLGAGYGSYNSYRVFGEYNSGVQNNKGLYVRASHLHSDGYKDRSVNSSQSVFYSSGWFGNKQSLLLTGFAGRQQNQMAWLGVSEEALTKDRRSNANTEEDDVFAQTLLQLQHSWYPSKKTRLQSSLYYNYLKGNYDFDLNNFLGFEPTEEMLNYALQSHFGGFFSTFSYESNGLNWTTGVHMNRYSREHVGSERSLGHLYSNIGFKRELSVFSKAQYQIQRLSLFADIQYRMTDFSFEGAAIMEPMAWAFVNPKAGISLDLSDNAQVYYSIGRTSREPTRTDIFGGWDDPLVDSVTNKAILFISDPESVLDHEAGIRFRGQSWHLNMNAYYMAFENEIVLSGQFGPNGLALNNKVDQSFRSGIELDAAYQLSPQWKLINQSSISHNRIQDQGASFSPILTPPLLINQEILYMPNNWVLGLSLRYQGASFLDFANTETIDPYVLANARIVYRWKQWQFTALLNNLTNAEYYNHAYVDWDGTVKYFVQAPMNGYLGVEVSF